MRKLAGPINAVRAEMGLREPVRGIMRDWWMSPQRVLALFPDWFAPRRGDWPPQTVLTRFPLYDGDLALDPAAERFLDAKGRRRSCSRPARPTCGERSSSPPLPRLACAWGCAACS